jgi:hypothetical protein
MTCLSSKKWYLLLCLTMVVWWKIVNFPGNVRSRSRSNYLLSRRSTSSPALIMADTLKMTGTESSSIRLLRRDAQRPRAILLSKQQQQRTAAASLRMPMIRLRISNNVLQHNPDLGGLKIEMMESDHARREIPGGAHSNTVSADGKAIKKPKHSSDASDAGDEDEDEDDDDDSISKYMLPYADDGPARLALLQDTNQTCTRRPWHRTIHPTCNSFHETDLQLLMTAGDPYYIGGGSYRTVYLATRGTDSLPDAADDVVWKTYGLKHGIDADTVASFVMDGVVGAALTPHPRLVNMWGFCAVSMFSEVVRYDDEIDFQN